MNSYDVIVVGLGAMGSAACYYLSKKNKRVLGIDRFTPPHNMGSSHGQTRAIREAYFEDPIYVPMVQKAYKNWFSLEEESAEKLLRQTGCLVIGPKEGVLVTGALKSADMHNLQYEIFDAKQIQQRFPAFIPDPQMVGVLEPRGGILFPERCIYNFINLSKQLGSEIRCEETVQSWHIDGKRVKVITDKAEYSTDQLILSAGAWVSDLIPELQSVLKIQRQTLFWFDELKEQQQFQNIPVHIWEYAPEQFFYGFPNLGDGVKLAFHHGGEITTAGQLRRKVADEEIKQLRQQFVRYIPDANGKTIDQAVCMYTNTPDGHFILDFHPQHKQVFVASPCSGHGFKFSSVIGEIIADMLVEGSCEFDLSPFKIGRLL